MVRDALLLACLGGACLGAPAARGEDWPSWRGPRGDGISGETGLLRSWPREGLRQLWRVEIGSGFSSFAAVGGRLYTLAERGGRQKAFCLEGSSGKTLWEQDLEEGFVERQGADGPRATPAVREGKVYVLGARGTLAALDSADGRSIWRVKLLEELGAENLTWGLSASPLLDGERVVVPVGAPGAGVVAFHAGTGDVLWRSQSDGEGDRAGYSTPLAIEHAGARQLVVLQGRALVSLDPESGKLLWTFPWRTSFDVNASAPLHHDGRLFISTGYQSGCALLEIPRAAGKEPREVWRSKVMRNKFSSCVLWNGFIYGFDENRLKCVEFSTGKERWKQSGLGHGTVLLSEGRLIVLGDSGDLVLVRAEPERYQEEGRMDGVLVKKPCWTVPVVHQGVLYLRDLGQAVALSLRG